MPEAKAKVEKVKQVKIRIAVPDAPVHEGPGWHYPLAGAQVEGNQECEILGISGKDAWVEIEPGLWIPAEHEGKQIFTMHILEV